MKIVIRPYQEADVSGIMHVWEEANKVAHPFLSQGYVNKVREDIPAIYLPNADTWIAQNIEKKDDIVGFLSLIGNEVGAIFVLPDSHRKGVGRLLMDKAQSIHDELEVEVFKKNQIGRNFYWKY